MDNSMKSDRRSITALFNAEAASIRPAMLEVYDGFVLTTDKKTLLAVTRDDIDVPAAKLEKRAEKLRRSIKKDDTCGEATIDTLSVAGRDFRIAVIGIDVARAHSEEFVSDAFPAWMDKLSILDHEIGHLLVPGGYDDDTTAAHEECAADAYALLRHVQRFGDTTDIFMQLRYSGAYSLMAGVRENYTVPVVDAIEREGRTADLTQLSLDDTIALAARLSAAHYWDDQRLKTAQRAFRKVEKYLNSVDSRSFDRGVKYEKIWATMTANDDTYRAGLHVLLPAKDNVRLQAAIRPVLQQALDFIDDREKNGFILNTADATAQNSQQNQCRPSPRP